MKYYKVIESGNYCGYDEEYLIKSEKGYDEVENYAIDNVDDRSAAEAFEVEDDEEELHISYDIEEISEEEFNKLHEEYYYEIREV